MEVGCFLALWAVVGGSGLGTALLLLGGDLCLLGWLMVAAQQ